ncbi:MAG: hypothetical protein AB2705_22960 [Candidatus Thiodiazotropha sp.]
MGKKVGWLVVLGLTALWDSISVYIGPSPREREKEAREKMSKQPPPAPSASTVGPCHAIIQISMTPLHWKFTQHHCTTRSLPLSERNGDQIEVTETPEQQQGSKKNKREQDGEKTAPDIVKRKGMKETEIIPINKGNDFKWYLRQLNQRKTFAQLHNECENTSKYIDEINVDTKSAHFDGGYRLTNETKSIYRKVLSITESMSFMVYGRFMHCYQF